MSDSSSAPMSDAHPAAPAPSDSVSSSSNSQKRKPEDENGSSDHTEKKVKSEPEFSSSSVPSVSSSVPLNKIPKKNTPIVSRPVQPKPADPSSSKPASSASSSAPSASSSVTVKREVKADSDSEDDTPLLQKFQKPAPKPAPAPAAKPAPKPAAKPASSSSAPKPAAKPAPKPAAKKPEPEDDDDGEDDEDDDDEEDDEEDEEDDFDEDESPRKAKKSGGDKSSKKDAKAAKAMKDIKINSVDNYTMKSEAVALVERNGANKWWEREQRSDSSIKWETLDHNGPILAPPYEPHHIAMLYEGKPVKLNAECEEVATMYAAMLETDYVKSPIFNRNFFRDWKALPGFPKELIKDLGKCDFTPIFTHVKAESAKKKLERKDPEVKKREKEEKERLTSIYGWALVDGYKEKMANPKVEPPGLFRGRGAHPKTGTLKHRIQPEDITINIGRGMAIPKCPDGHKWKGVIHNNTVTWLAYWNDNVNGAFKYLWLAPSSRFKGESDRQKYAKAIRLKDKIKDIRDNYNRELDSKHYQFRQRSTAIYLIDVLALRVGNEKDTSEVADTVGCCSLRVEHIKFQPDEQITLDFLGKDSMRYFNTVKIEKRVYRNLQEFCKNKKPADDIFDSLTTTLLNDHLKSLMPGLTAKVFRTYNASITLQKELHENPDNEVDPAESVAQKLVVYNRANREVAILCNHQKSVSKGHENAMSKLQDALEALKDEQEELEDLLESKSRKVSKETMKAREKERSERFEARWERRKKEIQEKGTKDGKSDKEIKELISTEEEKLRKKKTPGDIEGYLDKLKLRIENYEAKIALKDDSKEVSLGTSKINYMDPRITVAWCKAKEVPIEKIFGASLLSKFPWAMEVKSDWRF